MLKETALFAAALLFRASFGFVSPPAYFCPQVCNAWTAKSNIIFPEAGPLAVGSSNGIVGDKIKPASTLASPAKRGGPSAKASNETVLKPDERPEASGQPMGGNSACDQETATAGGAKEIIEVDAAESLKLEPLTAKPATALEDGTIKIRKKSKGGVVATPETTAAEKVLTLLELGLVDKEDVTAYYDALSELERSTRGAKEAAVPTAFKASLPSNRVQGEGGAVELVLFPAACAILGATGMHSLHLTGDLFTVASTIGAIAGGAVGWVVVSRDDVVGGAAKSAGLAVARSASFIGSRAGRSIKETAAGATSAITSGAVEIVVNAPAKAAGELAKTVSDSASSAVGSVAGLPGKVANNAVEEAKSVLQETSETVIGLAGDLALQAADAAGGALLYTSKAAVKAVKEPQQGTKANQPLQDTSPVAGERQKRSAQSIKRVMSTDSDGRVEEASSVEDITSLEALDTKMASVREALERFDAVKNRIETAQTSESLTEVVNMTRRRDATPEPETGEATPTTAPAGDKKSVNPPRLPRVSASSSSFSNRPEAKRIDEEARKKVAERLLERASQKAAAARDDLRASEASARREVETIPKVGGDARKMAAGVAVDVKSR